MLSKTVVACAHDASFWGVNLIIVYRDGGCSVCMFSTPLKEESLWNLLTADKIIIQLFVPETLEIPPSPSNMNVLNHEYMDGDLVGYSSTLIALDKHFIYRL